MLLRPGDALVRATEHDGGRAGLLGELRQDWRAQAARLLHPRLGGMGQQRACSCIHVV